MKFWKKAEQGIEFVKHYRAHMSSITGLAVSHSGELACSIAEDKTMKVFDVVNFDMITMRRFNFKPGPGLAWIFTSGDALPAVAVSNGPKIHVYDGPSGEEQPVKVLERLHEKDVKTISVSACLRVFIS